MEALTTLLTAHHEKIIGIGGVAFLLIVAVIALTPRKDDDEALTGFLRSPIARRLAGTGALATAAALAAALLGGCGGSGLQATRYVVAGTALGVVAVDPVIAEAYDDATADYEVGELTKEAFEGKVRRLDRAERALGAMDRALRAVDLALGAYEDGRECGLGAALEGAARAARELVASLEHAGLDVPPLVTQVLDVALLVVDGPDCPVVRPAEPPGEREDVASALRDLVAAWDGGRSAVSL
jgi:hypothetical protein